MREYVDGSGTWRWTGLWGFSEDEKSATLINRSLRALASEKVASWKWVGVGPKEGHGRWWWDRVKVVKYQLPHHYHWFAIYGRHPPFQGQIYLVVAGLIAGWSELHFTPVLPTMKKFLSSQWYFPLNSLDESSGGTLGSESWWRWSPSEQRGPLLTWRDH